MKKNIKSRIAESFELPKEVILDIPKLKVVGNNEVGIENHKGIVEYNSNIIRMNTTIGIIKITGLNLHLKEVSHDGVIIAGEIISLEYVK